MENVKKRLIIVVAIMLLIAGSSLYGYLQKSSSIQEMTAAPISAADMSGANVKSSEIIVYVSGAVNKPGVFKAPNGSRVLDVVNIAGGLAPGAESAKVNLAELVKDGSQINVPGIAGQTVGNNQGNGAKNGDKINLNTGNKEDFDKLPGIGPALAERIVEYRKANGSFKDVADLKKVSGIGEAKFNQLKDKITL